jgi:hypothetical protein
MPMLTPAAVDFAKHKPQIFNTENEIRGYMKTHRAFGKSGNKWRTADS